MVLKSQFKPQNIQTVELSPVEKEYENEIWWHLKQREQMHNIKPTFMRKQMYLSWKMRSIVIDWLVTVAEEYQMSSKCIHLSVNYIDRFLSSLSVVCLLKSIYKFQSLNVNFVGERKISIGRSFSNDDCR